MDSTQQTTTDKEAHILHLIDSEPATFEQAVLARWLRDPAFRGKVGDVFEVGPLRQPFCPFHDLWTSRVYELFDLLLATETSPNEVMARNAARVMFERGRLPPHEIDTLARFAMQVASIPAEVAVPYTNKGLKPWLSQVWAQEVMTHARLERWPVEKVTTVMADANQRIESITGETKQRFFTIAVLDEQKVDTTPRIRTRLPDFDRRVGGGLGMGEGYLVIGARGAGKTIFGLNAAVDVAAQGYKVAFISTELTAEELYTRAVSDRGNIPYGLIKDGIPTSVSAKFTQSQLQAVADVKNQLFHNLHVYEWPDDTPDASVVNSLPTVLDQFATNMGGLHLVVLDWIGGALGRMEPDPAKVRMVMQMAADEMARIAKVYGVCTITTAQAHIDRGINKPWVDDRALAECKQLGRNMVVVAGITAMFRDQSEILDDQGYTKGGDDPDSQYKPEQGICLAKSRKGAGGYSPVQRDFKMMRFATRPDSR